MIEKAKAAGISQEQIDAAMKQKGMSNTTPAVKAPANPAPEVDRNTNAEELYKEPVPAVSNIDSLTVYGHEIFSQKNLTFAPNFNIATPKNYKIGTGDELVINIWGASEDNITKKVSPEGRIVIPMVGPIAVAGLTIEGAESKLRSAMSKIYAGLSNGSTRLTLSLGNIRSIKVNIVGEVMAPGTYTLPSLATLFNAIYMAGGVNKIGSLRNIKVYRNSNLVGKLDVYDYLLNGKFSSNVRLEDNDMVVIEPYEKLVTIRGNVKRPRIFEMKQGESLGDLIRFSGGFTPEAYSENLSIKRSNNREYEMHIISKNDFGSFQIVDGDEVSVGQKLDRFSNKIEIKGAVYRPGDFALTEDVATLKQLVDKAEGVKEDAFLSRVLITRTLSDLSKQNISVDLGALLQGRAADVSLQKWDVVYVPSIYDLIGEQTITIGGAVTEPKTIPFKKGMTIEDLILEAGGLKYEASLQRVEIARRIRDPHSVKESDKIAETFIVNIKEGLGIGSGEKKIELQPFDEVVVRYSPGYEKQQSVSIDGEVIFPGSYVMATKNQRLSSLVKSAGGVSSHAYVKGARLHRLLTDDEREKVKTLVKLARQSREDSIEMSKLELATVYSVGIDLEKALDKPNSDEDIVLREGDKIYVPQYNNTVRVSGSVLYPNTITFDKRLSFKDYIAQAGGYDGNARKRNVFVVYMNGKVAKGSMFFNPKIEPGCEIVVPSKPIHKGMSTAEVLGYSSSAASIAAMVATLLNALK